MGSGVLGSAPTERLLAQKLDLSRLLRKRATRTALAGMLEVLPGTLSVRAPNGSLLLGDPSAEGPVVDIEYGDGSVGSVQGNHAAEAAQLIGFAYQREAERRGLVAETLDRYKEITLLYDVAERLAACLDMRQVAETVLHEALKYLGGDGGVVLHKDRLSGRLVVLWSVGDEFGSSPDADPEQGILGRVFTTGRAEVVEDVTADQDYVSFDTTIRSLICAPLRSGDDTVALLRVSSREVARWNAGHLKLINSLAAHAASALENAALHQRRMRQQRTGSELDRHLSPRLAEAVLADEDEAGVAVVFADLRELAGVYDIGPELEDTTGIDVDGAAARAIGALLSANVVVNRVAGHKLIGVARNEDGPGAVVAAALDAIRQINAGRVRSSSGFGIALGEVRRGDPGTLLAALAAASDQHLLAEGPRVVVDEGVRRALDGSCRFEARQARQSTADLPGGYEVVP